MSIRWHLIVSFVSVSAAVLLSLLLTILLVPAWVRKALDLAAIVIYAAPATAAFYAALRAMRCIPATCPQCGGQSYPFTKHPICYECAQCGHVVTTRVHAGW
jgi:hypothetical protein